MWEELGKLPVWLKAIPILVLGILGIVVAIKIFKSEKVKVGKDGLELDDSDDIPAKLEPIEIKKEEVQKDDTKN